MEDNSKPILRIAGIIIKDNKILLVKGKKYEIFWTPGGKAEEDETNEECLKRELKEELQVDIEEAIYFKEYFGKSFFNPDKNLKQIVYIIKINGEPKPNNEIADYIWFSKDDFKNKKYEIMPSHEGVIFIDLIKEGIW